MKTSDAGAQCGTRIQHLRRLAQRRAKFTSIHLILLAFAFVMAFGGLMKFING